MALERPQWAPAVPPAWPPPAPRPAGRLPGALPPPSGQLPCGPRRVAYALPFCRVAPAHVRTEGRNRSDCRSQPSPELVAGTGPPGWPAPPVPRRPRLKPPRRWWPPPRRQLLRRRFCGVCDAWAVSGTGCDTSCVARAQATFNRAQIYCARLSPVGAVGHRQSARPGRGGWMCRGSGRRVTRGQPSHTPGAFSCPPCLSRRAAGAGIDQNHRMTNLT
jgi:hypothetical protein